GIVKNDVRRLSTELLADTLDRVCGPNCNIDPCACRAGERDHVDVPVVAHGSADIGPEAIDQIEHSRRYAGVVKYLREDQRTSRSEFRRLEDHCAAGGKCRPYLAGYLVQRPVPGRDHADNADRLAKNHGAADSLLERIAP